MQLEGEKLPFGCEFVFVVHSKPPPTAGIQMLHRIKVPVLKKKGEKKKEIKLSQKYRTCRIHLLKRFGVGLSWIVGHVWDVGLV